MDQKMEVCDHCAAGVRDCPVIEEVKCLRAKCKELSDLAQTDPLTGLFNLRYLLTALDWEMERTRRTGIPSCLLMIDLDYFKRVNDTYGHQVGNEVLKWAGGIFRKLRRIDIVCRYGGEEFAVILPGVRLHQAVVMAERLRAALADAPMVSSGGDTIAITASFGVEVFKARDKMSPDQFIQGADRFLLEAKAKGRNCVCFEERKAKQPPSEVTREERAALFIGRWPQD